LWLLNFVWEDKKIAINYFLSCQLPDENKKPTEMQKLASKVLKYEGWEILDLTEREFKNWTYHERVQNIVGWVKEAKQRQIKKGIIEATPPKYA